MRFNINPSFSMPAGPVADNRISTAFALVGTLQFREAYNSGYLNFKKEDLINAAIPIIQRQALILYHSILLRYAFAHAFKGNFIHEKYYTITPDCFLPSMDEIQYYLNDPKGIFRFSAKNYYGVTKLLDNNSELVDIEFPIVTFNNDRSSILEYLEPKMGKFRKNLKKTFISNPEDKHYKFNIKKLKKFYKKTFKFKLNEYESLEFLFTDDFYLHEMLPDAYYEDFIFNLITGQCDFGLCGLRQDEIYFKDENKDPLEASTYLGNSIDLGDDSVIKNLRKIVNNKKTFFKIKHRLYQSSSWIDKAFQAFSNNPYHFYRFIVSIYGKEASFEKFLTYDKSTRTYIRTGWEAPCSKDELKELITLYNAQLPSFHNFSNYYSFRMVSAFYSDEWMSIKTKIQKLIEGIMKDLHYGGDYKKLLASKNIKSLGKIPDLGYTSSQNGKLMNSISAPIITNTTKETPLIIPNLISSAPILLGIDLPQSSELSVYITAQAEPLPINPLSTTKLNAASASSPLPLVETGSSSESCNNGILPSSPISPSLSDNVSVNTNVGIAPVSSPLISASSVHATESILPSALSIISAREGSNNDIAPVLLAGFASASTSEDPDAGIVEDPLTTFSEITVPTPAAQMKPLQNISHDTNNLNVSTATKFSCIPALTDAIITGSTKNILTAVNAKENEMFDSQIYPTTKKSFIVHSVRKDPSKIVPWDASFDPQSRIKSILKTRKKNEIVKLEKLKTVSFSPRRALSLELNGFSTVSTEKFFRAAKLYEKRFLKECKGSSKQKVEVKEETPYPFPLVNSIPVNGRFSLPKYIYVKPGSNVLPSSDLKLSFHPYICSHNLVNYKNVTNGVPICHKRIVFPIKEFYSCATAFADSYKNKNLIVHNDNNCIPSSQPSSFEEGSSTQNYCSYLKSRVTNINNLTKVNRKMIKRIGTAGKVVKTRNIKNLNREMKRNVIKQYGRSVFRLLNKEKGDDDDNLTDVSYEESRYVNKYDFTKTLYKGFANNKFYYLDVDTIQIEIINEITTAFEDYNMYNDAVVRFNEAFDGEFCYGESYPIEIYEDSVYRPDKISLKIIPFPTATYNTSEEFRKAIAHYLTLYFVKHEPHLIENNEKYYQSRIGMQYQSELHSIFVYMVALDRHISELYMAYQYIFKIQGAYDHVINYQYEIRFLDVMKKFDIRHAKNLENENNLFNEYLRAKKGKMERKELKEKDEVHDLNIDFLNLYSKVSCDDDKFRVINSNINDENINERCLEGV